MKICKVENCEKSSERKNYGVMGFCRKHYNSFHKYGKIIERTIRTPNEILDKGDYCEMLFYNNKCQEIARRALFSKRHIDKIKQYKWGVDKLGYCYSRYNNKRISLHHFIKGKPPKGLETDHINRNPLDNRDENLRFISHRENMQNLSPRKKHKLKIINN